MALEYHIDGNFSETIKRIVTGVYFDQWSPGWIKLTRTKTMFSQPLSLYEIQTTEDWLPQSLRERFRYLSHHQGEGSWQTIFSVIHLYYKEGADRLKDMGHPAITEARKISKDLSFESHKLKAYLRFRKLPYGAPTEFWAYHSCEHNVLPLVASFLTDRFRAMSWHIATKWSSATWNKSKLTWGSGEERPERQTDPMDELWRGFYRATYNPDRYNPRLFKHHVPQKYWHDLPEIFEIGTMMADQNSTPSNNEPRYTEKPPESLPELNTQLASCQGCSLVDQATQVVPGKGRSSAKIMIVGEQPGDKEDLQGEPFIGPAGKLLMDIIYEAGMNPDVCYMTNAVKHFRFETVEYRRIHKRATVRQISACRRWLIQEIEIIKPLVIVCLGATALRAVIGRPLPLKLVLNQTIPYSNGSVVIPTYHPSAILRAGSENEAVSRKEILKTTIQKAFIRVT